MKRALPLLLMPLTACSDTGKAPVTTEPAPISSAPVAVDAAQPAADPVPPGTPVSSTAGNRAAATPRRNFPPSADCQMHGAGDWSAHIDAMPGPGARPRLIVTGAVATKPAARLELRLDPTVLESYPPQRIVELIVRLPSEPTNDSLVRGEVRGEWPVEPPLGAVHIRCGGRSVASIGEVVVAH